MILIRLWWNNACFVNTKGIVRKLVKKHCFIILIIMIAQHPNNLEESPRLPENTVAWDRNDAQSTQDSIAIKLLSWWSWLHIIWGSVQTEVLLRKITDLSIYLQSKFTMVQGLNLSFVGPRLKLVSVPGLWDPSQLRNIN